MTIFYSIGIRLISFCKYTFFPSTNSLNCHLFLFPQKNFRVGNFPKFIFLRFFLSSNFLFLLSVLFLSSRAQRPGSSTHGNLHTWIAGPSLPRPKLFIRRLAGPSLLRPKLLFEQPNQATGSYPQDQPKQR
jgi:hypothetical protein